MGTKHTPGPWKASPFSSVVGCPVSAQPDPRKNTIIVASTRSAMATDAKGFRAEVEANARLIAAAPELLEALLAMVDRWEPDCDGADRRMWENARAAISKARGK